MCVCAFMLLTINESVDMFFWTHSFPVFLTLLTGVIKWVWGISLKKIVGIFQLHRGESRWLASHSQKVAFFDLLSSWYNIIWVEIQK